MNGFLELTDMAPANAGATPGGAPSEDNSILPEGDGHEFSDAWVTLDGQYHWHECECGFRTDMGEHTYEYVIDSEPTPTSSGWKHRECTVCGKKGPKIEMYYSEIATPDNNEPTTPPADNVETNHDNCVAENWFASIINAIVNFFRQLIGLPEVCYCGKEK